MNTAPEDDYASLVPPTRKEMGEIRLLYLQESPHATAWYWNNCLVVLWRSTPMSVAWTEIERINRISGRLGMKVSSHSYGRLGRWRLAKVYLRGLSQNEVRRLWG